MTMRDASQDQGVHHSVQASPTESSTSGDREEMAGLAADLLIGAEAIAKALNWRTTSGSWNKRRVYHLADKGKLPFHKVPGLGVVCRKTALDSFFRTLDERFLRALDADSSKS